ncbi:MerR family transcriptional regulator [Subtercola sp. PAMC28395]|uniref:MerR family transcriptional regulator n=1 Tax=Subtercola sp. PAMC28395 TaxID=2846775 RepID=UPI001C0C2C94|nr:MerR family transcriptional regulator [Subtercola sp. PAMC28395]QWT23685.1 MerR family transcriptional regulator [Subtercola sp. PAMC28395]
MEWSINDVARLACTTSRTLRHYDSLGLLAPSRVGSNGYRYYDEAALARLQRILLLRELGVGLPSIAEILANRGNNGDALRSHLRGLHQQKERLDRQIDSVELTISRMERGEELVAEEMFEGFEHTQYKIEVEHNWGAEAYAQSSRWWNSLTTDGRTDHAREQHSIQDAFTAAHGASLGVDSSTVHEIVKRHFDWITAAWGGASPTSEQFVGIADMYVADERFSVNYGGIDGARYVRDAMIAFAAMLR